MKLEVFEKEELVAKRAAAVVAEEAAKAISLRGRFVMAVSGGQTPWKMLEALASEKMKWDAVHILQVDERFAPDGDPERNFTHINRILTGLSPIPRANIHPMNVVSDDPLTAAAEYSEVIRDLSKGRIDLVHLGLGTDGHTASLVPGDDVLDVTDRDVALTGGYMGRRRMTLTYPAINHSAMIMWLVTGPAKRDMLGRLIGKDLSIPAGRIYQENALVIADRSAADGIIVT